jgi:hypothetical protein
MCDKSVIISNGKKLYLATFELISGEYGQIFYQAFYARDENSLENRIHKYLKDYYGKRNNTSIEGNVYYYFNGEVAVKSHSWDRITSFEQLIDKLL